MPSKDYPYKQGDVVVRPAPPPNPPIPPPSRWVYDDDRLAKASRKNKKG